jgi:uncharacterized protein YndB with AHSA1/START domain
MPNADGPPDEPASAVAGQFDVRLIVRRSIRATPERLFELWTEPRHLLRWWGPAGVECSGAEVDLRPGGAYRIANRMPDGGTLWISGVFAVVDPPSRLVYSWRTDPAQPDERVTVRFERRGDLTEVIIEHERIADERARRGHEAGWIGCLDGLDEYSAGEV